MFVSAGEPSGDLHAAAFIRALKEQVPGVKVEGFGGAKMINAGAELMERMENLTVIGFIEVLKKVPAHWRLMRRIERRLKNGDVRLLVLVDYPGFHLRVAHVARRQGVPVLYYIAPQLWAWHESRVRKMAQNVARLAVILPFEKEFFEQRGVPTTYVGHPLLDRPPAAPDKASATRQLGLDPSRPVLGLFPGSRPQETARLWPDFRDAAMVVREQRPNVQCVVAAAGRAEYPEAEDVLVARDRAAECFLAADVALSKSGTTTIEAALAGAPQVIAYRMNRLSYFLARRLVKVPWIGMVNLIAGKQVAPEFVQDDVEAELLASRLLPLFDEGSDERRAQLEGIRLVRERLGGHGAAARAAAIAKEMLAA